MLHIRMGNKDNNVFPFLHLNFDEGIGRVGTRRGGGGGRDICFRFKNKYIV